STCSAEGWSGSHAMPRWRVGRHGSASGSWATRWRPGMRTGRRVAQAPTRARARGSLGRDREGGRRQVEVPRRPMSGGAPGLAAGLLENSMATTPRIGDAAGLVETLVTTADAPARDRILLEAVF